MGSVVSKMEFNLQFPVSLVEQITKYLTHAIIEGQLKNGQQLIESELQRKFGISRAPIRESFRILEENGLLASIPRKGTFVKEITRKAIEENFPIRAHLESLAARLAAPLLTHQDIERMELALSGMMESARVNDLKSHLRNHADFHHVFINATKNDTLIKIVENLRRQAMWFRFSYLYLIQEPFEYALHVHREILALFIKKDIDRLEVLVKEHIMVALQGFLQLLDSKDRERT